MNNVFTSIKTYFEDELKIVWEEFWPYEPEMSEEEKEKQDWDNFIITLRE